MLKVLLAVAWLTLPALLLPPGRLASDTESSPPRMSSPLRTGVPGLVAGLVAPGIVWISRSSAWPLAMES